jgi:Tfp pilus assembly protein PilO
MRSNERMILVGVAVVALAVGFYLFVLGPKRDKAGELKEQVTTLNGSITAAQQQVTYGEQARQDFAKYYGRMVVLGKAVPGQSDTASMLVQLSSIAEHSKTDLRAIGLNQGSGSGSSGSAAAAPSASSPPAAASTASTASSTASTGSTAAAGSTPASSTGASSTAAPAATTAAPAPATEASAAALPIGSVVGAAGLPTLPYSVTMTGNYFDVANFVGKVDDLVEPVASGTQLSPDGRLLTINGFGLQVDGTGPSPTLTANLVVTAYSTGDQGLTLGASPSGPAPTSPGETQVQPTSAVVAK